MIDDLIKCTFRRKDRSFVTIYTTTTSIFIRIYLLLSRKNDRIIIIIVETTYDFQSHWF